MAGERDEQRRRRGAESAAAAATPPQHGIGESAAAAAETPRLAEGTERGWVVHHAARPDIQRPICLMSASARVVTPAKPPLAITAMRSEISSTSSSSQEK